MIRTQISLTEEQAEGLGRLARARRRSQAALIREALDRLLAEAERADRLARARAVIGAHSSGTSTTAEAHDEVLAEAYRGGG